MTSLFLDLSPGPVPKSKTCICVMESVHCAVPLPTPPPPSPRTHTYTQGMCSTFWRTLQGPLEMYNSGQSPCPRHPPTSLSLSPSAPFTLPPHARIATPRVPYDVAKGIFTVSQVRWPGRVRCSHKSNYLSRRETARTMRPKTPLKWAVGRRAQNIEFQHPFSDSDVLMRSKYRFTSRTVVYNCILRPAQYLYLTKYIYISEI